jgi:Tfp pilus assembly protein PilN
MRALDLNLASHPFRNNTPIWVGHAALLAGVLLFGAWNVRTYVEAVGNLETLQADIGSVERQLAALDRRDQEALKTAREFDLKTLQAQADEANEIILRRSLSWTRLFNQLEKVVPYEVRTTTVRPVYSSRDAAASRNSTFEGTVPIDVEGVAQSLEAFFELERALIMDPHFSSVEPIRTESSPGAGEVQFELRFLYDPDGRLGGEHPEIPHILDAARKAAEEGGEAPASALKGLP